jgi:hypothetical protein
MAMYTHLQYLIETENLSPNIPDSNSYTPMHAAASYAHTDLLEYLISVGGDINLRDEDGDTPLFVVESVEMARWMVERGAEVGVVNEEGLSVSLGISAPSACSVDDQLSGGHATDSYSTSPLLHLSLADPQPAQALEDEHPQISAYLASLLPSSLPPLSNPSNASDIAESDPNSVSALAVDQYTSQQTTDLLAETRVIMEQCERDGTDPDERLREVVERAVREGFNFGGQLGDAAGAGAGGAVETGEGPEEVKRLRENGA